LPLARRPNDRAHVCWLLEFLAAVCVTAVLAVLLVAGGHTRALAFSRDGQTFVHWRQTIPGLVVYRFYGPLVFANVRFFIERLEQFIAREAHPVREIIVDARAITVIDLTAAEQLQTFIQRLRERGIELVIAKAHLPFREAATFLGLQDTLSAGN